MEIDERIVFVDYYGMIIMVDQRFDPPFIKATYDGKDMSIKCDGSIKWFSAGFPKDKYEELRAWVLDHQDEILNKRLRENA